jgi:hypothetical protein
VSYGSYLLGSATVLFDLQQGLEAAGETPSRHMRKNKASLSINRRGSKTVMILVSDSEAEAGNIHGNLSRPESMKRIFGWLVE